MGSFWEEIPQSLIQWILDQNMFWVATAPLSANGHINVSPKGGKYFGILDSTTFWYMDISGSGNETISHLLEPGNGRITVMFNAFDGPPKIVRLWGKGVVMEKGTSEFSDFVAAHSVETIPGTRSIIRVDIHQVGGSCGFSVPYYDFKDYRPILNDYFKAKEKKFLAGKEEESMDRYWAHKNAWSMDNLPGMRRGLVVAKAHSVKPMKKMVGPLALKQYYNSFGFTVVQVLLIALLSFLLGFAVAGYNSTISTKVVSGIREGAFIDLGGVAKNASTQIFHSWQDLGAVLHKH